MILCNVLSQGALELLEIKVKISKKSVFIKQSSKSNYITFGVLMSLEEKLNTVSHLKVLCSAFGYLT